MKQSFLYWRLVIASIVVLASGGGYAAESFEGTFYSHSHMLRLHQVGSRVCGEWSYATERSNREGLVAGIVVNGKLQLNECPDFELVCTPESPNSSLQSYTRKGKNLSRASYKGSSEIYVREKSGMPIWNNAQAKEVESFLNSCQW